MTTKLRYKVLLIHSEEGVAVSCPSLPGCWSQGANDDEALANIADAIRDYLAALEDLLSAPRVCESIDSIAPTASMSPAQP